MVWNDLKASCNGARNQNELIFLLIKLIYNNQILNRIKEFKSNILFFIFLSSPQ